MMQVSLFRKKLSYAFFLLAYRIENLLTGVTPLHIVVSGPDDDTRESLVEYLRHSYGIEGDLPESIEWRETERLRAVVIVTGSPDDFSRADKLMSTLSRTRKVFLVSCIADPRQLVCQRSIEPSGQFKQGADYRLDVGPGTVITFTQPGVLERLRFVRQVENSYPNQSYTVRRENLFGSPESVLQAIAAKTRKLVPKSPDPTPPGLWTIRRPESTPWESDALLRGRVSHQIEHFPGLEDEAVELGYKSFPKNKRSVPPVRRGTIIAFHTPDDLYRGEAERLRRSLETLGLPYIIREVEGESSWARTCLLKPLWIAEAREENSGPLLYLDADAYVQLDPWPLLSGLDADFGAVVHQNGNMNGSTLWIDDTDGARWVLSEWGNRTTEFRSKPENLYSNLSDQDFLRELIAEQEDRPTRPFRFVRLPRNLQAKVGDEDKFLFGPPYVEQLQVSRELRTDSEGLSGRRKRLAELDG